MATGRIAARRQHFLSILARYARAKMEVEGISLDQLAEKIGASGKNWVFRVLAHDEDPGASGGRVDDPIMRLIDWVGFGGQLINAQTPHEPTFDTHWCDIRVAIMRCAEIPEPIRDHLWWLIQGWARTIDHYEGLRCGCGEKHYCESEVVEIMRGLKTPASEAVEKVLQESEG